MASSGSRRLIRRGPGRAASRAATDTVIDSASVRAPGGIAGRPRAMQSQDALPAAAAPCAENQGR